MLNEPEMIAASLVERDDAAGATSRGRHLRSGDRQLDWAIFAEASDLEKLRSACARHLHASAPASGTLLDPPVFLNQIYRVAPR